MLADDFDTMQWPDLWACGTIRLRLERDVREPGKAATDARRAAHQALAGVGALASSDGLTITVPVTPATVPTIRRALEQLHLGERYGQLELMDVTGPDRAVIQRWPAPENLRRGELVDGVGGTTLRVAT